MYLCVEFGESLWTGPPRIGIRDFHVILIEDKIISLRIFEEYFLCHYKKCRGACCIEGESGAPLQKEEVKLMRNLLPQVWDLLTPQAQSVIEVSGISYEDPSGEEVTALVNGGQCVFATFGEDGSCLCSFEKRYREGFIDFPKPISCHLYPIRIHHYPHAMALNFDDWNICRMAKVLGKRKGVVVFRALKEPLIRAFGEPFFQQLEACYSLLHKENGHVL